MDANALPKINCHSRSWTSAALLRSICMPPHAVVTAAACACLGQVDRGREGSWQLSVPSRQRPVSAQRYPCHAYDRGTAPLHPEAVVLIINTDNRKLPLTAPKRLPGCVCAIRCAGFGKHLPTCTHSQRSSARRPDPASSSSSDILRRCGQ